MTPKAWFPYSRPGRPGLFKLHPSDRGDYMETPQEQPRTIEKYLKDRDDRDGLDRKISIRKTETIAKDRRYFNGNPGNRDDPKD